MGFTILEANTGRNRPASGTHREFILQHDGTGLDDENTAAFEFNVWLTAYTSGSDYDNLPGIPILNYTLNTQSISEMSSNPATYKGTADWRWVDNAVAAGKPVPPPAVEPGESSFTYNAQAEGGKIATSIKTQVKLSLRHELGYPDAVETDYMNFNGFINAELDNKKFKYNGVDLSPPPPTFEINWAVENSVHTSTFQIDIMKWVGTMNKEPFSLLGHTFDGGELFFNGVTGTKRTMQDWELNFSFSYSMNRMLEGPPDERVPILGGEVMVPKSGHDYLWVYGVPAWDPVTKKMEAMGKYASAYVEQVWPVKDWTETSLNLLQALTPGV